MKRIVAVLFAVLCAAVMAIPALAYERTTDAKVYTDFNTESGKISSTGPINCESGVVYLNGMAENTTVSIVDGAAKIEMGNGGFAVFGQNDVQFRNASGALQYQYLVIRIKGEKGNENRTQAGGILLFIGGGDGDHAVTLNDRPTGVAPAALDANNKPMNAISTEWQEFAIRLTESNVRRRDDGQPVTGLNINTVSVPATLYIDDIYVTNTAPKTAAVYDPSTATSALTDQSTGSSGNTDGAQTDNASGTQNSQQDGETVISAGVEMLDPPSSSKTVSTSTASSNNGLIVFIIGCALLVIMTAAFVWIYFAIIKARL